MTGLPTGTIRFAYGIPLSCPLDPELSGATGLTALARAAEAAGFSAGYVTEHPIPSQRWRASGGHDALDPFVALTVMSCATTSLRLLTNLTVIPYRNPFLLAKATASLDVVSGGRLIVGAGVGYLKSEFAALGVDYESRNDRFDEYLEVLKLAWQGRPVDYQGRFLSARGVTPYPPPLQRPGPPIWLGGNSKRSRRRAVEAADGWIPMPAPRGTSPFPLETLQDLEDLLAYATDHAAAVGRDHPLDVAYALPHPGVVAEGSPGATDELLGRLQEIGVTWVVVNGEGHTLAEALAFVDRFGDRVLGPR